MPARQTPCRQRRRPQMRQFDLFDTAPRAVPGEPEWNALPEAARREVMTALTRLMLDHGPQRALQDQEARHDD